MCRDISQTGRRCPCDTSEARRLRRHNATARSAYANMTLQPVEPKMEAVPVITEPYTVQGIRDDIASLRTLRDEMHLEGKSREEIALAYNQKLDDIGSGIEYLAEEKFGAPNDDRLRSGVELATMRAEETARLKKDAARVEHDRLEEEEKALKAELEKIANRETHPVMAERFKEWEEKAPELYAEYKAKEQEVLEAYRKIYSPSEEAREEINVARKALLEQRNAGFRAALEEVGVQFADPETIEVSDDSHKDAVKSLKNALSYYPQAWVDASNAQHRERPLRIKRSTGRAHYSANKEQKGFTHSTKAYIVGKPEGWVPDPHERRDSEYIDLKGENTWTDPKSGVVHESYYRNGDNLWLAVSYNYHKGTNPPKGGGWEKCEFYEEKYVPGEGFVRTGELYTTYRKPQFERRQTSWAYKAEITVSKDRETFVGDDPSMRVAMHEFAHRVEHTTPVVTAYEDNFLKERAGHYQREGSNMEPEGLTRIYSSRKELGYKDNFPDHYMGKVYTNNYRELLSMGMESVFAGTNGALAGLGQHKADPGYKRFILGVLASSASTTKK